MSAEITPGIFGNASRMDAPATASARFVRGSSRTRGRRTFGASGTRLTPECRTSEIVCARVGADCRSRGPRAPKRYDN
jgi:hypothetical protein